MADLTGSKQGGITKRGALRAVLGVVAAIVILAAGALSYRAWRQYENSRALAIDAKTGVEETMYVCVANC